MLSPLPNRGVWKRVILSGIIDPLAFSQVVLRRARWRPGERTRGITGRGHFEHRVLSVAAKMRNKIMVSSNTTISTWIPSENQSHPLLIQDVFRIACETPELNCVTALLIWRVTLKSPPYSRCFLITEEKCCFLHTVCWHQVPNCLLRKQLQITAWLFLSSLFYLWYSAASRWLLGYQAKQKYVPCSSSLWYCLRAVRLSRVCWFVIAHVRKMMPVGEIWSYKHGWLS